jgi:thiamine pyrophosphokinase
VVLADGEVPAREALDESWPGWADGLGLVVAADGGARLAGPLGLSIDAWIGDGDSLPAAELAALERAGVDVTRVPAAKDESDAELAVRRAIERGATDLTILGGLGGPRFDHALANIGLLSLPGLGARAIRLLDARTRVTLADAPGPHGEAVERSLAGRVGDVVSLLPLDAVEGVTTVGLEYPLADEPLPAGPARGLSNVRSAERASLVVRRGRLLVVEGPGAVVRATALPPD